MAKVRGKKYPLLLLLLVFGILLLFGFFLYRRYQISQRVSFFYEENEEVLKNPARGFYTQISYKEPERLKEIKKEGQTLALVTMSLKNHLEEAIPAEKLERLSVLFEEARKQQVMLLFRAAYKQDEDCLEPELSMIKIHIEQLAAVMNAYRDVVLAVQTGMVGLWGEWHGSVYLEDEDALKNEAMKVVEWWLQNLDESINLNLRRPLFIQTAIEAGLDGNRLGMHNDALLATDSDMGTYLDRSKELLWCAEWLNGKVNGGEMPYVSAYTKPEHAKTEFTQLSLTYLNAYYNAEVLEAWEKQTLSGENALEYMEKHLGYRYSLEQLETNETLLAGAKNLQLDIRLKNSGFSTIQSRFHLYLVLDDGIRKQFYPLKKENDEKAVEIYRCSIALTEQKPFLLGFCYTDAENAAEEGLKNTAHTVQFANDEIFYQDGVNYVLSYQFLGDRKETLIPQQIGG